MYKRKTQHFIVKGEMSVDEAALFKRISEIIEGRKTRAGAYANREIILMYWEVGIHINSVVLDGGRADYGKTFCRGCRQNCWKFTATVFIWKIYTE